jgi:hypothetical protein
MLMRACLPMLLAGCATSANITPPETNLPPVPADIQACFVGVVDIPDRDLTVADVERLWKADRVRSLAQQKCGRRLLVWIADLKANWQ